MPLRYVDPNKKRGRGYAAVESFARSGPGQFVARHVFWRIDPWLYRVSGGRYPWIGMVTAPLTSTGANRVSRECINSPTSMMDVIPSWSPQMPAHRDIRSGTTT